jgi:hypothetical protein
MRAAKLATIGLAIVASLLIPAMPASASSTQVQILAPTSGTGLTNGYLKLKVRFGGGIATQARNCNDLAATYGGQIQISTSAAQYESAATGSEFRFSEIGADSVSLTCELVKYWDVYPLFDGQESVPIALAIRTTDGGQADLNTILFNPAFKGQVGITSPSRGQSVSSIAHLDYSIVPGANRSPDTVLLAVCSISCTEHVPDFVDVLNLEANRDGSSGAGIVLAGGLYGADVAFTSTGLTEIMLRTRFGGVTNDTSVMVNVSNDIYNSQISWDDFLKLSRVSDTPLGPDLDCGNGYAIPGSNLTCTLRADTGKLITDVPFVVFTSTDGGQLVPLGSGSVRHGSGLTFQVAVPKTALSVRIVATPSGMPDISAEKEYFGPPPKIISAQVPSTVQSKRPFSISVTISSKAAGFCDVSIKGVATIGHIALKNGRGTGQATIRLSATAPKSLKTPLVIDCAGIGGSWKNSIDRSTIAKK